MTKHLKKGLAAVIRGPELFMNRIERADVICNATGSFEKVETIFGWEEITHATGSSLLSPLFHPLTGSPCLQR
ncbi:hypothetical protein MN186_09000 [Aliiroseovarius sp. N1F302]|uniref:hypothetical protein n=1 Tax=Aliiroseovarius sediminis TaxID=2925839 RepID=UPI001F563846|nr:hypothetical protein [Aliiroseovarius sediminis]MCI2394602.1 hypothetical protein [Aliiroseovarius sediminis]